MVTEGEGFRSRGSARGESVRCSHARHFSYLSTGTTDMSNATLRETTTLSFVLPFAKVSFTAFFRARPQTSHSLPCLRVRGTGMKSTVGLASVAGILTV